QQRTELGRQLRQRLLADHVGEGWCLRLAALYRLTDDLRHAPRPIAEVRAGSAEPADVCLSLWCAMRNGRKGAFRGVMRTESELLAHEAFVAKVAADYARGRRHAWRAVVESPWQWPLWR